MRPLSSLYEGVHYSIVLCHLPLSRGSLQKCEQFVTCSKDIFKLMGSQNVRKKYKI